MVVNVKKHIEYPDLEPLFRPKSIAIIGASDDTTKPSGLPLKYALDHGYKGKLFPVNPKRETVQGLKAYPSIGAIPEEVDACVIVIPAEAVLQAIKEDIGELQIVVDALLTAEEHSNVVKFPKKKADKA